MADHVIFQKISSLARCINRIEEKRPESIDELINSYDLQDIISVNLEWAIQQSVDIALIVLSNMEVPTPATMAEAFVELKERKVISEETAKNMISAVGFRNIIVHTYKKIDWEIVWSIITKHIEDFKRYSHEIIGAGY